MSLQAFWQRANEPEVVTYCATLEGAGANDLVVIAGGKNMTFTRTGVGTHTLSFNENPQVFLGMAAMVGDDTPGNVAGHKVVRGAYDGDAFSVPMLISDALDAAADLTAGQYLDVRVYFKRTTA